MIVPTLFFSQCLKTYKFCQYFKYISSKNRFIVRISCSTASHNPMLSMVPCITEWVNWCTCSWALVPRPYNPKRSDVAHPLEWIPKQNMKLPVLLHMSWVKFREKSLISCHHNGFVAVLQDSNIFMFGADTNAAKLKRDKTIIFCYHALQEVSYLEMKN